MNGESLVIVKHCANGKIEVEHRLYGSLLAAYNGYPRGSGWYQLYPVVSRSRDVRYAGKIMHETRMQVEIRDPAPASSPVAMSAQKPAKTEAPQAAPDFKQVSIFDRSYLA